MEIASTLAMASIASGDPEASKHVMKMTEDLYKKYFGEGKEASLDVKDEDTQRALEFIKNHAVKIDKGAVMGLTKKGEENEKLRKGIRFIKKPRGEILD